MELSRFFHKIKLENDNYAIFNSLIMDVIYIDKNKLEDILSFDVNFEEMSNLKECGIYISEKEQDQEALNVVRNRYSQLCGKIHILYLVLTSACNLACKYCFIENCTYNNKKEIDMSIDTVKNAIEKYTNYLRTNDIGEGTVIFYGGEPLINWPAIVAALEYAKDLKATIKFSIVTNATLLDSEKIKYLSENNVEIGISIDGPKELNDKNRIYKYGKKSVYDQVIQKFPKLKINNCKFGLSITVSKDLIDHQEEVLNWLKRLGVNSIFYNLYHFTSYTDNWEEYYEKASEFLLKSYDILSDEKIYDGRLSRKLDSVIKSEFKFADCGAIGGNQLSIKPNGDVCICHGYLKTDKYVIGNINKDCVEKLMESDEISYWKQRCTLNVKECLDCEAVFTCGGGCAIQSEALFGDRSAIDKPFCIHTKTALKWVLQRCYDKVAKELPSEEVI